MDIHICDGDIHLLDLRTRMPFKYGIATMTHCPHALVRLHVEVGGKPAVGVSADHLPPKWFTKNPQQPLDDEIAAMLRVIEHAVQIAAGIRGDSPFHAWQQLWEIQSAWGRIEGLPPLLTHFGTSLVERALIEAVCRTFRQPFHALLRADAFGVRPGDIHPVLGDQPLAGMLPSPVPQRTIVARHTIGLADPLTDEEIAPAERLDDGLPQSLIACVQTYGLRHFKIKVSGTLELDRKRLQRIAETIHEHALTPFVQAIRSSPAGSALPAEEIELRARRHFGFSLDGNEQFHSLAAFRTYWMDLTRDAGLQAFLQYLRFVEQPLHRAVALDPAAARLTDWPERPPIIIDESDAELDSFPRALALGYAGTSHKNCKGVFKSVANVCLSWHLSNERPQRPLIISGEELANIGPVALLQDLAVCAALGIHSVERNGHHYFAGLSMFPEEVQRQVLGAHGDLYRRTSHGWPTLTLSRGLLGMQSINAAPFGVGFELDVGQFLPIEEWRRLHPS